MENVAKSMKNAQMVGAVLAKTQPQTIDIAREFSQGPNGGKSFLSEGSANLTFGINISNPTDVDVKVAIGSATTNVIGLDTDGLLNKVGATCLLASGIIFTKAVGGDDIDVTASILDSDKSLAEILAYMQKNPTRFLSAAFQSSLINGNPESSNYSGSVKMVYLTPWENTTPLNLNLSQFLKSDSAASQFMNVDFRAKQFPFIVSEAHVPVLTIKKGTQLNITFNVGVQDSRPQRFWRAVKQSDSLLAGSSIVGDCNC